MPVLRYKEILFNLALYILCLSGTHPWPFSKSKFNLKSDRINLVALASPIECLRYSPNVRAIQYKLGPERLTRFGNSNVLRLPVLGVFVFVSNKDQNGWINRTKTFCGTSNDLTKVYGWSKFQNKASNKIRLSLNFEIYDIFFKSANFFTMFKKRKCSQLKYKMAGKLKYSYEGHA